MAQLPDLVRDARLEVQYRNGCTVHIYNESNPSCGQRVVRREETWKHERQIGSGAFRSVWLERCISATQNGAIRAVQKIVASQINTKDAEWVRELEAVTKFSHPKVWSLVLVPCASLSPSQLLTVS